MGISLVRYDLEGQIDWGLLRGEMIFSLDQPYDSLRAVLETGREDIERITRLGADQGIPLSHIKLLSPITTPARIIGQGPNYLEEAQTEKKAHHSFFFRKDENAISGPYEDVLRPEGCHLLEASLNLGLVIGKSMAEATKVSAAQVPTYVAGWIMGMDVTSRDHLLRESGDQWYLAKSYRRFAPMGPIVYLPSQEEWESLGNLELRMWVNGELKQQFFTRNWMQQPAQSLQQLSAVMNLDAGDVLLTGGAPMSQVKLPSGMVQRLGGLIFSEEKRLAAFLQTIAKDPAYLQNGDKIRATITSADGNISLGEQHYSIATS
ncbi:MAG: fumarylacetoacetate hydrolase family protein [Bacteroidia bacterium]|nr:fumarylacetoacetate hydrolase family protein [Bacteroidia bacterium]